jgi:hypothetical protein
LAASFSALSKYECQHDEFRLSEFAAPRKPARPLRKERLRLRAMQPGNVAGDRTWSQLPVQCQEKP